MIQHQPAPTVALLCLLALLGGCETTSTAPADSRLTGSWQLDRSASDDPDAIIAKAVGQAEARFRRRLVRYGVGGPDSGGAGNQPPPDGPDYSLDTPGDRFGGMGMVGPDFRGMRARLHNALLPAGSLRLDVDDDTVSIGADQLPPREYHLGEKLSRIDEYGTAIIRPEFQHQQFVLRSSYTSHAQRVDTYDVDSSGALTVVEQINDPGVGRLVVRSVYRRS